MNLCFPLLRQKFRMNYILYKALVVLFKSTANFFFFEYGVLVIGIQLVEVCNVLTLF